MPSPRFLAIALLIILLCFGVTYAASQFALDRPQREFLTDDTKSKLLADYSPDAFVLRVAPTRREIINAAIEDEAHLLQPQSTQVVTRVQPNHVPTPAPQPAATATPSPTPVIATAQAATPPPLATREVPAVSPTVAPQQTPQPPATPQLQATSQPIATPQPTVAAAVATSTPFAAPSPTALVPAATATPFLVPTPTPMTLLPSPTLFAFKPPSPTPFTFAPPSPTPFLLQAPTATRTPTPFVPPPLPSSTPLPPATATAIPLPPTATATAIPGATSTPAPAASVTPTLVPTATATPAPATPTPVAPAGNAWLLLHDPWVPGAGTHHRMSNAVDGVPGDQIDTNHGTVDVFHAVQPIAWAAGTSDWTVRLVMRDKPNGPAPASIKVWSQAGGCTDFGAVPLAQRYANSTVSIANAVDRNGIAVGVTATGAPQHAFAPGEVLCLSILAASGSGSGDLHYYGDTFSTSGLPGRSALFGPFSFANSPYLLHQATAGGNRTMSTSSSGAAGDQVSVNTGSTVTFQATSPVLNVSGLSPWPLQVVVRDSLVVFGSLQAQVWKQTGACTNYTAVPVGSRLATGTVGITLGLGANSGVSASLPGTGAGVSTMGPSDLLCLSLTNSGAVNLTLKLDTPASIGSPGKSSLGGPYSQVAGVRTGAGHEAPASPAPSLLPLLAAWLVLMATAAVCCLLSRR